MANCDEGWEYESATEAHHQTEGKDRIKESSRTKCDRTCCYFSFGQTSDSFESPQGGSRTDRSDEGDCGEGVGINQEGKRDRGYYFQVGHQDILSCTKGGAADRGCPCRRHPRQEGPGSIYTMSQPCPRPLRDTRP